LGTNHTTAADIGVGPANLRGRVILIVVLGVAAILLLAWLVDRRDHLSPEHQRDTKDLDYEARNNRINVTSAHFLFTDVFRRGRRT
jgi:Mg2+/citrate symporter